MDFLGPAYEKLKKEVYKLPSNKRRLVSLADFDTFHYSVRAKIWEASYFSALIKGFNGDDYKLTGSGDSETYTTTQLLNKEEIAKYANLYADGFFISTMSILDSFACQVNSLYGLIPATSENINFLSVSNELKQKVPNSELYKLIKAVPDKYWWKTLKKYRNTTTHEAIIIGAINTSWDDVKKIEKLQSIYLPDDPKKRPFRHIKKCCLFEKTTNIEKEVLLLIQKTYKKIIKDLDKSKKLPIEI